MFDPLGLLLALILSAMVVGSALEWREYQQARIRAKTRKQRNG